MTGEQLVETWEATAAGREPLVVVGIGASAGGLGALRTLFGAMPRDPGFAFVVVVHLSSQHESHFAELLQPYTQMRVQQIRSTVKLEANNVYVIPPDANVDAIDTHLRLSELEPRRQRAPIDHFLRTLARAHDGRSVAVILTGSGSDGSLGCRKVKESGGVTIAQDPEEAEYASMPRNAIQTGTVDLVLKLREIPSALARVGAAKPSLPTSDETIDSAEDDALNAIVAVLGERVGKDFAYLRRSVMLRRVTRRMQLLGIDTLAQYVEVLRTANDEPRSLCNELLFVVNEFFADAELFAQLELGVLPNIFAQKGAAGSRVRVWSIGCSTGEEAYSLAILLLDAVQKNRSPPKMQVFASDLSADSLEQARKGVYPHEVAASVSPDRLARYFLEQGTAYRVAQNVRDLVVFAEHDLLRDPPYAHVDLIVCRNLLSELQPEARRAVLATFHYALEPTGRLVLGPKDTIDDSSPFEYEDRETRVLKPVEGARRRVALAPSSQLCEVPEGSTPEPPKVFSDAELASLHRRLLERYTPPSLLLSSDDAVLHYSTSAGRYVRMPGGEPTDDVYRLLCAPLPIVLRSLLGRARREGAARESEIFTVETDSGPRRVVLRVEPPSRATDNLTLVVIDEIRDPSDAPTPAKLVATLQTELDRIHGALRGMLQTHSEDRDELTGSNEHLASANEELKFILAQLEASRQEIQTANEELTAIDLENRRRLDELGRLSGDLRHLLESTGIGTLLVDRELRIVRFTPQLADLFNVRELDVGRPLADITHSLDYEALTDDARRTLDHLTTVDREVRGAAGRWYLIRMLPYRTVSDRVDGVVLTFIDITDRKRAEEELRAADRRKDEFLALLAHELRNPLAPIVAGIDLLQQAKNDGKLLDQIAATMSRQAKQLVRLVDDLLELSRVSGGRLRLRKSRVLLRDVVRDAVASVRPIIERQRHEFRVTLPEEGIELVADGARLTQVVANLLNNAVRYTPEGGSISVEATREGNEAIVMVRDNGIGIAAPALERIFEMFYQVDEGRPARGGGLGIGLTLARSLVEMHGGTITAESAGSNRGSEFKVRLPVADHSTEDAKEELGVGKSLGGHRVLIVDDNTDAARTLGMLVETLGHNEVHVANNGSDALRLADEHRPDIVLLDLKMPGMDGYEVARRLRSESWGKNLTLVAVTGWTLEDHRRRSRDAGFDQHLTKPADVAALAAVLAAPALGTQATI